jgi:asparagine synthase (glutamine-hydrolysing)
MLEPGAWIEVTVGGHIRRGQIFAFPYYETPSLNESDAIEAVDTAVIEAVKRYLISDVPVGAFLSGGIDSPLVVAKMRAESTSEIRAFTIGTGEDATDESKDAIIYAQEIGFEHTVEHVTPDKAIDLIDDVIDACGEPRLVIIQYFQQ